jgi:hypothetical protein
MLSVIQRIPRLCCLNIVHLFIIIGVIDCSYYVAPTVQFVCKICLSIFDSLNFPFIVLHFLSSLFTKFGST